MLNANCIKQPPTISIIVPVFNTADYLPKCVESILSQSFEDFELILIDDGSTDGSVEICDRYARENENVICIHQPNKGVSAARNRGIEVSSGRYIWFCDSDDMVVDGALATLSRCIEDSSPKMIVFSIDQIDSDGGKIGKIPTPAPSSNERHGPLQCGDLLYPYARVVSRRVIGDARFDTSLALLEDRDFCYRVAWKAVGSVTAIDESLYLYLITRSDSAVNSASVEQNIAAIKVHLRILENEESLGYPMPAFQYYADHALGVLSLIVRAGSSRADYDRVRCQLVAYRGRIGWLKGYVRTKYLLAVYIPILFNLLAKIWNHIKRDSLGSIVLVRE